MKTRNNLVLAAIAWGLVAIPGTAEEASGQEPAIRLGERLFIEERFARSFYVEDRATADELFERRTPVLRNFSAVRRSSSGGRGVSCVTCHSSPSEDRLSEIRKHDPISERGDGRTVATRNSPPLLDAISQGQAGLLHFDGEFATAEMLVAESFLGRNFGWLPEEREEAKRHFARVIRGDDGTVETVPGARAGMSYASLLRGTDPKIPMEWRLPERFRLEVMTASDDEVLAACARLVGEYLKTLQFSRDAEGRNNGSPYDAFLAANRLPLGPSVGEDLSAYTQRLFRAVMALGAPRFVDDPARRLKKTGQAFAFGEMELRGLKIFFREAVGSDQRGGAGSCVECHVPPGFTDSRFHNTGVVQLEFDALNGEGAFGRLVLPGVEERSANYDRWLQPTSRHPKAAGRFLSHVSSAREPTSDLGMWNVYANPDIPAPQKAMEELLNADGRLSRDEVLSRTVGRFKTTTVRALGVSAPYLHTGNASTLEAVIEAYRQAAELARAGKLRNAPPEFFGMRLSAEDVVPLVAFLRALNEE